MWYTHITFYHTVMFCPNKHFILRSECTSNSIHPSSIRSFRLAKWEREGEGWREGKEGGKEVEGERGREEERGRSRLGDPS